MIDVGRSVFIDKNFITKSFAESGGRGGYSFYLFKIRQPVNQLNKKEVTALIRKL